jgi:hypothetical protein
MTTKENIFLSPQKKHRQSAVRKYEFDGQEYNYLVDEEGKPYLEHNFHNLMTKERLNFRVKLCLYRLVNDCKEPFLEFLLTKNISNMGFSEFEIQAADLLKSTNVNSAFQERCAIEFMKIADPEFKQHVPPETQENYNSFSSGNSITEKAKEIIQPGGGKGEPGIPPKFKPTKELPEDSTGMINYRGFLEVPNDAIYVMFDCTYLKMELNPDQLWGILDEIVNEKHIYKTPIDIDICNMIQEHEFIAYIKDSTGNRINMPCCLYLCAKIDGKYQNVYHAGTEEEHLKQKSIADAKIDHAVFGHSFLFSTDPIDPTNQTLKLKRYSVFIDNALYILNIDTNIKSLDFFAEEEDDLDESHKSVRDYNCIYFFDEGLQLWCVKGISRFTQL